MEEKYEDFKWFGEGFKGFPKHLPEDCVEYILYTFDPESQESTGRARLRQILQAANTLTKRLLTGFIWQREPFGLDLVHDNGKVLYTSAGRWKLLVLSVASKG